MIKSNEAERFSSIFSDDLTETHSTTLSSDMNDDEKTNIEKNNNQPNQKNTEEQDNYLFTSPEVEKAPWDENESYSFADFKKLVKALTIWTTSEVKKILKNLHSKIVNFASKEKPSIVQKEDSAVNAQDVKGASLKKLTIRATLATLLVAALSSNQDLGSLISKNPVQAVKAQFITTTDPVTVLSDELNSAYEYASKHGNSFFGYTINTPVIGVAGNTELILTLKQDGRCWSTGVANGYPAKEVRVDASGARCEKSNLEKIAKIIK